MPSRRHDRSNFNQQKISNVAGCDADHTTERNDPNSPRMRSDHVKVARRDEKPIADGASHGGEQTTRHLDQYEVTATQTDTDLKEPNGHPTDSWRSQYLNNDATNQEFQDPATMVDNSNFSLTNKGPLSSTKSSFLRILDPNRRIDRTHTFSNNKISTSGEADDYRSAKDSTVGWSEEAQSPDLSIKKEARSVTGDCLRSPEYNLKADGGQREGERMASASESSPLSAPLASPAKSVVKEDQEQAKSAENVRQDTDSSPCEEGRDKALNKRKRVRKSSTKHYDGDYVPIEETQRRGGNAGQGNRCVAKPRKRAKAKQSKVATDVIVDPQPEGVDNTPNKEHDLTVEDSDIQEQQTGSTTEPETIGLDIVDNSIWEQQSNVVGLPRLPCNEYGDAIHGLNIAYFSAQNLVQQIARRDTKIRELERENESLKSDLDSSRSFNDSAISKKGLHSIRKELREANERAEQYDKSLHDAQKTMKLLRDLQGAKHGPHPDEIRRRWKDLSRRADDLIFTLGSRLPQVHISKFPAHHPLHTHFQSLTGGSLPGSSILLSEWHNLVKTNNSEAVVRSFILVGLQALVFDCDWPLFVNEPSPLLDMYRNVLRKASGNEALRAVDLAAHYELVYDGLLRGGEFDRTSMLEKAKRLSKIFNSQLASLFASKPTETLTTDFETWGQTYDEASNRQYRMADLFRGALELKSRMLLTRKQFSTCFIAPGTPFDPETMKSRNFHNVPARTSPPSDDTSTPRVMICFSPALYQHDPESDFVQYQGTFKKMTAADRGSANLIAKAAVALDTKESRK